MAKEQETRITIRFPSSLVEELKPIAESEERSLNWSVVQAVREYVARKRKEGKKRATQDA
ncbi:YlcI/YnfO family protein [Ktedonobacter robiniae]|uniref:Ribbon-helix-helix protein CopG domain-containing protein n=1 Tax=Ktedonobacter robiniae TaxID=2778365 RepID=A0ABQ3UG88_9CHLR|nr:YlcI/YnfO family protein [Ktedonobacter robiniae]GHO51728.1 hypothetical protein KSB_02030 [Ktedonobacter robiniae]